MKGRITEQGILGISRRGTENIQECPYRSSTEDPFPCGDWCPLFGEPRTVVVNYDTNGEITEYSTTYLRLCRADIQFDEFVDEREE